MKIQMNIQGMHCGGCEKAVRRALEAVPSVVAARIDLGTGNVQVEASGDLDRGALLAAVEDAGYEARIA